MRVVREALSDEGVSRAIRASNDLQTSPSSPERQMTAYALFGNGSRFRDKSKLIVHIAPKVGSSSPLSHHNNQLRYWWEAPDSALLLDEKTTFAMSSLL